MSHVYASWIGDCLIPQKIAVQSGQAKGRTDLKVYIRDVLSQRHASRPVNDLHSNGSLTLCLQHVIDQILGSKVDIATPVRVVLT